MDNSEYHSNSILVNDPSIPSPSSHDSQYFSNENDPLSFVNQDDSMSEQDNHTPLRLNGDGDTSFENQERFNPEHQGNVMKTSLSEQDIRDVLFEAGYTVEVIDDVLAAKVVAGLNDLSDSTISVESEVALTDQENISMSDSVTENAFDKLKEIRIKNVNNVTIGTLNINSLAPKFEQLREIIGKNLDILTIQETKLDSSFPTQQFCLDGYSAPYRMDRNREGWGFDLC